MNYVHLYLFVEVWTVRIAFPAEVKVAGLERDIKARRASSVHDFRHRTAPERADALKQS